MKTITLRDREQELLQTAIKELIIKKTDMIPGREIHPNQFRISNEEVQLTQDISILKELLFDLGGELS